jgi:signal transduction histidine kinase
LLRLSLRQRILAILAAIILITVCGGLLMVWTTYRVEEILREINDRELPALQGAEGLENALIYQKGFLSYFLIDGDPAWLEELERSRRTFAEQLWRVAQTAQSAEEKDTVRQFESEYRLYIAKKDRVIELYRAGESAAGAELHRDARRHFDRLLAISGHFKAIHTARIHETRRQSQEQALRLRLIASIAVLAGTLLTLLLGFVFVYQILQPLRRLAAEADRSAAPQRPENEVAALSRTVHGLLSDVDKTQSELERSRESLVQSEKMALVGKLAAGMAHSLRNPFTSVKMRLFSLRRSLELDEAQRDDFEVISAEIRHIDTIVQNFLEFSRPPKLKMQPVSPSATVDAALQLLEHRLKSYDVAVTVDRPAMLPLVSADPEQLKEVLANLIVNACEAMGRGGSIRIEERVEFAAERPAAAVVRVRDSGPGIPPERLESVFQPFFTTKDEGTGLGLSIARRIIDDHGGRIWTESTNGRGAVFTITLPLPESADENHSGH